MSRFLLTCAHSFETADYLNLLVELLIPEGSCFSERRFKLDASILELDVQHQLILDQVSAALLEVLELVNPALEQLLQSLGQNLLYLAVELVDPYSEV